MESLPRGTGSPSIGGGEPVDSGVEDGVQEEKRTDSETEKVSGSGEARWDGETC